METDNEDNDERTLLQMVEGAIFGLKGNILVMQKQLSDDAYERQKQEGMIQGLIFASGMLRAILRIEKENHRGANVKH